MAPRFLRIVSQMADSYKTEIDFTKQKKPIFFLFKKRTSKDGVAGFAYFNYSLHAHNLRKLSSLA